MSCLGPNYNPFPPRVWSRVDVPCQYANTSSNTKEVFQVYIPALKISVPSTEVAALLQMINKGNILQYKNNSSQLTKNQRYSQIAKGMWTNRHTTWATQGIKYTNPNIRSLQRVNATNVFQATGVATTLPVTCPYTPTPPQNVIIATGGTMPCNTQENVCTGQLFVAPPPTFLSPSSNSDVPGPIVNLYWNPNVQTWYPKNRTTMNSSGGNKFPEGYKGFVPA